MSFANITGDDSGFRLRQLVLTLPQSEKILQFLWTVSAQMQMFEQNLASILVDSLWKSTMIYLVMCVFSPLVCIGSYSHCCWLPLWLWCPVHWWLIPAATSSIHNVDTIFSLFLFVHFQPCTERTVTVHDCYNSRLIMRLLRMLAGSSCA